MEKKSIKAFLDNDTEKIIQELGLSDKLNKGEIECCYCKRKLLIDDIKCIVIDKGTILFCCNSPECYKKLLEDK